MWKYIVYWTLVTHTPAPCGDRPHVDEFGRAIQHFYAISCEDIYYDYKHRDFASRKEAFEFYKMAKSEILIVPNLGTVDSVRIDSTKIF